MPPRLPIFFGGLLLMISALAVPSAQARDSEPLIILYDNRVSEPYIIKKDGQVVSGIHWDLAQYLGEMLGRQIALREAPRKRVEQYLLEGHAHVLLLSNPAWLPAPEILQWSIGVYTEYDILIQRKDNSFAVNSLADLTGKRLGTMQGYVYQGISDQTYNQSIIRDDATNFRSNFLRLQRARVDVIIVPKVIGDYLFLTEFEREKFHTVPTLRIPHTLYSAVSPHSPVSAEQLSEVYRAMHNERGFEKILSRYR